MSRALRWATGQQLAAHCAPKAIGSNQRIGLAVKNWLRCFTRCQCGGLKTQLHTAGILRQTVQSRAQLNLNAAAVVTRVAACA